jgi:hypothetical protein
VVAGLFAGAYLWMHAMQRDRPPLRLRLSDTTTAPEPEVTG